MSPLSHIGRVTIPLRKGAAAVVVEAFEVATQAWNVCVDVDRRGGMSDAIRLKTALGKAFGQGMKFTPMWEVVLAVVSDYQRRRKHATSPLRKKASHRMKSIPAVGPLQDTLTRALHSKGLTKRDLRGAARLRRTSDGFFAHALIRKPSQGFTGPKIHHHSLAVVHGLTMTEQGLVDDVSTLRQLDNSGGSPRELREGTYLLPLKDLLKLGSLQAFFRKCVKPDGLLVGLDLSMLPSLSNRARHGATLVRRWFRSRQAAGAIDFRQVSTLGGEARAAFDLLERGRAPHAAAKFALESVLSNCPECGCSVHVQISPTTGAPVGATCPCSAHRRGGDYMGRLLARRSAVHALDGRRQAIVRGHYDPRSWAQLT